MPWGARERHQLCGWVVFRGHRKQTRAVGLWAVAGSRLQHESLTLGQGQSCEAHVDNSLGTARLWVVGVAKAEDHDRNQG